MKIVTSNNKQNTRDVILHALKLTERATIAHLAEAADIAPVTVRHHLNGLQAEGLLNLEQVRGKVGRPHYVYSLSKKGNELFPQKYIQLNNMLLDELKNRFPSEVVADLIRSIVARLATEHEAQLKNLSFEERLSYLTTLLTQEGFLARWERVGDVYQLTEYSCPYRSVGKTHREICTFDRELIQLVMQTDVQQDSCILTGSNCCQFTFSPAVDNTIPIGNA